MVANVIWLVLLNALSFQLVTGSPFDDWKLAHGKRYNDPVEEAMRSAVWERRRQQAAAAAAANPHARFGVDFMSDMTDAERSAWKGGPLSTAGAETQSIFRDEAVRAAGPIDWVALGAVNTPISQGRCGTCAQFSATADIEAQWFLNGHELINLAVQEMIDCSSYTGPYGMGWVSDIHKGLTSNATYPLANHSDPTITGCRSPCNTTAADPKLSVAHIDGATCAGAPVYDNETQMLAWLQHGPLSISIDAHFDGYKGGVLTDCNHTSVDHAVLLVGYGVDTSVSPWLPYWKIKNSWGPAFGEGGYVRMQAGVSCLGLRGACQAYIGQPPKERPKRAKRMARAPPAV